MKCLTPLPTPGGTSRLAPVAVVWPGDPGQTRSLDRRLVDYLIEERLDVAAAVDLARGVGPGTFAALIALEGFEVVLVLWVALMVHLDAITGLVQVPQGRKRPIATGHTVQPDDLIVVMLRIRGILTVRQGVVERRLTPVFIGSAYKNKGIQPLLDAIVAYLLSLGREDTTQASAEGGS